MDSCSCSTWSCLQMQAGMQRFMAMYRMVAFVVMVLTLLFKVYHEWHLVPARMEKIGWFNFTQFAAIFGQSFQALANQVCFVALTISNLSSENKT